MANSTPLAAILILCCFGASLTHVIAQSISASGVCPEGLDTCWAGFKATYNKPDYGEAEGYRKGVFASNVQLIDAVNGQQNLTFKLGLNSFADLTGPEFLAGHTGSKFPQENPSKRRLLSDKALLRGREPRRSLLQNPTSLDWRTSGKLQPVQAQTCGTCWAFAATAVAETTFNIASGQYLKGSEEELIDCTPDSAGKNCSEGGYADEALYWIKTNGQTTSGKYPALTHEKDSFNPACDANAAAGKDITVDEIHSLFSPTEEEMKSQMVSGPVVVYFGVVDEFWYYFQFYKEGVYNGPCSPGTNHAMAGVGYGSENGNDYWLVRNSWGTTWGEGGYGKIQRGTDQPTGLCDIQIRIDWATKAASGYCASHSNPCQNGGRCVDVGASFKCECPTPYDGTNCETRCFDPNDCDFYFEGYQGSVPKIELGNGNGDRAISPAIINSKDSGQQVNVINTNQGYATSSPIKNDNQNQFYGSDKYVHDRTFNDPQDVNDYRDKCFKLRLSSVQLAQGNNPMNLNPNDGNMKYPEDRRCVVFKTYQAS